MHSVNVVFSESEMQDLKKAAMEQHCGVPALVKNIVLHSLQTRNQPAAAQGDAASGTASASTPNPLASMGFEDLLKEAGLDPKQVKRHGF